MIPLAMQVTVVGETEWQQHAEATRVELGNLLETSASFYHTFQVRWEVSSFIQPRLA